MQQFKKKPTECFFLLLFIVQQKVILTLGSWMNSYSVIVQTKPIEHCFVVVMLMIDFCSCAIFFILTRCDSITLLRTLGRVRRWRKRTTCSMQNHQCSGKQSTHA